MLFVTGGAGFIGSHFILEYLAEHPDAVICNIDALTYTSHAHNLASLSNLKRYQFEHINILEKERILALMQQYQPSAIIHFATENHPYDAAPDTCIKTNIDGTYALLEATLQHWKTLPSDAQNAFRFIHVSTDAVYGSLGKHDRPFTEQAPFLPNNPYAASKAAADHLVRAYFQTYKLPVIITHCTNNYGPNQFPEKLIPFTICHALAGKPMTLYGDGKHIRDWMYVSDHCAALRAIVYHGRKGETYNIGADNEHTNIEVVETICDLMDRMIPRENGTYTDLITYTSDRYGHDKRYAINAHKIQKELGWQPQETFITGLKKTITWYLEHQEWTAQVQSNICHNT